MVLEEKLFALGKPCFYIIQTDRDAFQNLELRLTQLNKNVVVRMIRGKKSRTTQKFFDEIAAALQFPYYFGENWNAFDECIIDLDWIEGDAYLLIVSNANMLLSDADKKDLDTLLHTLERANEEWLTPNEYIPRDRQPTPFHVLLQCGVADALTLVERLTDFHIAFELLEDR